MSKKIRTSWSPWHCSCKRRGWPRTSKKLAKGVWTKKDEEGREKVKMVQEKIDLEFGEMVFSDEELSMEEDVEEDDGDEEWETTDDEMEE